MHRKKWFEYLLETGFLFLAVFLGVFADNFREEKLEEKQEKIYISSMIKDLADDTTNLNIVIKEFVIKDLNIDTLLKMYDKLTTGYNHTLWRNFSSLSSYPDFISTDQTILQLKNTGGMQLIHRKVALCEIIKYDSKLKELALDVKSLDERYTKIRDLRYELIDTKNLDLDKSRLSIEEIEKGSKNYLLINNRATIGKLYNIIQDYKRVMSLVMKDEEKLKQEAIDLILLLKKEYNLNNQHN